MKYFTVSLVIFLAGCMNVQEYNSPPVQTAFKYIGLSETANRRELSQLTGVDPVRTEWCAAYVNGVLAERGVVGTNSNLARSFLDWGDTIEPHNVDIGDLVIFERGDEGWQGHVGFYIGKINNTGEFLILGGNQSNEVSVQPYSTAKLLGVRRTPKLYQEGQEVSEKAQASNPVQALWWWMNRR